MKELLNITWEDRRQKLVTGFILVQWEMKKKVVQ